MAGAVLAAALLATPLVAQEFREQSFGVGGVFNGFGGGRGQASFLDFDKDGDLDVMTAGPTAYGSTSVLRVYRNNGGQFSLFEDFKDENADRTGGAAWADIDKDGYADLVTWIPMYIPADVGAQDSGRIEVYAYDPGTGSFQPKALAINVSGIFTNPLFQFADYDDDGYPDLLVSAWRKPDRSVNTAPYTRILHNASGANFSDTAVFPTHFANGTAAWGDIDGDKDLDLFLSGTTYNASNLSVRAHRMYKYAAGTFSQYASLTFAYDVKSASIADYNKDGLGDLAVCGGGSTQVSKLFRNNGIGMVLETAAPFNVTYGPPNADLGAITFGDADRDGDPDLLISGEEWPDMEGHFTKYYENQKGKFFELDIKLPPYWNSLAQWVDLDQDGNLDIFLSGTTTDLQGQTSIRTALYRNLRGDFDTAVAPPLDSISGKRARFGDYDNDGDMDIVLCGSRDMMANQGRRCALYRNDAGNYTAVPTPFDALYGDPEWGDYDGDGRIDLLLAGSWGDDGRIRVFRNLGGDFAEIPIEDDLVKETSYQAEIGARWGDFDRDGDLDILAWGAHTTGVPPYGICFSEVLINQGGGKFTRKADPGMPGVCNGELEWGDFDRDGDLDVLLAGDTLKGGANTSFTGVYRNEDGTFRKTDDKFLGLSSAHGSWGDFDADGDLDFAIAGSDLRTGDPSGNRNVPTTWIYRLVDGSFEEYWKGSGLIGDVAWLDFDHDGDLDLVNTGRYFSGGNHNLTLLLRNNGLVNTLFSPMTTLFPEDYRIKGEIDIADYDKDGDEDFVVAGHYMPGTVGDGYPLVRLYKNTLTVPNHSPSGPSGLSVTLALAGATLSWSPGSDAESKAVSLRYNVRVGRAPGASDVVSASADPATGASLVPGQANAGSALSLRLRGLAPGTYYWSVQTVDLQRGASGFAAERSFTLGLPGPTLISAAAGPGTQTATLTWNRMDQGHFRDYIVEIAPPGGAFAPYDTLSKASDTVLAVRGLTNDQAWRFRLAAIDLGGNVSGYSNEGSATPDGTAPAIPSGLAAAPEDRRITLSWTGNAESDFKAYLVYQRNASGPITKIDSIADPAVTTKVVTGLKNGTPYSFLLVAADQVLNYSGFSEEAVAIPAYLLTPSAPAVAFGKAALDGRVEKPLGISNSSHLPVPVDSVRFVNGAFGMVGFPTSFPAAAETTLTIVFTSNRPAGGDYAGVLKVYYGGSPVPLEIDLSGSAVAAPTCRIDQIVPNDLAWDSSTAISFLASANDGDNAGEGDRIVSYLWSSSLAGPLPGNASGFTLRPDQLGLGSHAISLRVVDNEGDTSTSSQGTLLIRSVRPKVRIESITPAGLIIRGADPVRIRCEAHDLDEGAGPARRDLASFDLHSTLQGRISGALDTTFDPSALSLGLHGFYAVAVDDEGDRSVSDTSWVPVQAGLGLALIVAGTDFDDNRYFYENIAPNCNWAYSRLRLRGFTDSLITYFNPVGWQSIGGDYKQDSRIVDVTEMTVARLRERILGYKDRVRSGVPLLLSFIGHGGRADVQNGKFYLSPTEYLLPDSLDAWLDTYNQDADGRVTDSIPTPIVMEFDFCFSGTFFPKLRSSSQNRIVIASSSVDRQAYFNNGRSFSHALFRQIEKGGNLTQAFTAAKAWSDANTTLGLDRANPLANADNDNTANESEDFQAMNSVYVGGSQQDQGPEASWKDVQLRYDHGTRTFRVLATLEGSGVADTAWFTMLPPDFRAPEPGAADPFRSGPLLRQADGSYAGSIRLDPVLSGEYLFIINGLKDGEDLMPAAKRANPSVDIPTGLVKRSGIPARFDLGRNFPNPAAEATRIPLAVTRYGRVVVDIYGMDGRLVKRLIEAHLFPGHYLLTWDGRDRSGRKGAPGVYSYSLESAEGRLRRTLIWSD